MRFSSLEIHLYNNEERAKLCGPIQFKSQAHCVSAMSTTTLWILIPSSLLWSRGSTANKFVQ